MRGFLLDTDILSIFAKVNALALLREILGCDRLPITTGVFNEIVIPLEYGYDFPRGIMAVADTVLMSADEAAISSCGSTASRSRISRISIAIWPSTPP